MAEISESGYLAFMGTDSAAAPDPTAAGVRFYPGSFASLQAAEDYLRAHPDATYYTLTDITNLQVTSTSGGGGGTTGEVIAEDYTPGTPATPETGTDMNGQAFNTDAVKLN